MKPGENIQINLSGPVPSVKNSKAIFRGANGKPFISTKSEYKAQMASLIVQARSQWRSRPSLEHPDLIVWFYVRKRIADRDNKLNCIMDVLTRAGVLVNDNIARCNGSLFMPPAIVSDREGAVIRITPQQGILTAEGAEQTA